MRRRSTTIIRIALINMLILMEINYVKKTEYFYTFFDNNFVYVIS